MFKNFCRSICYPHRWVGLRTLAVFCYVLFYIAFTVGVFSLIKWAGTFWPAGPTVAAARHLYGLAALQAAFFCAVTGALGKGLQALRATAAATGIKK